MKKLIAVVVTALVATAVLTGCGSKAHVVSHNLSVESDNFQIPRSVSFYNGITGQNILVIKGLCSIGSGTSSTNPPQNGGDVTVTCKTGKNSYIKDFLGLSDNVTYVVQQETGETVSDAHYQLIWRPSTLIPGVSVQ